MRNLIRNLLFSLRMLLKGPGFVLTVVATLALGVGANTAIFTVVYATLLAPLPISIPSNW
jgi:putative ABC transport system permease protein